MVDRRTSASETAGPDKLKSASERLCKAYSTSRFVCPLAFRSTPPHDRQAQVILAIQGEVAFRYGVDLSDDGRGAEPVDNLVLVARGRGGVRRGLRDHQLRGHAALHRFGDGEHVVAAGTRVARSAPCVVSSGSAEIEFGEFAAIGVPLEDHGLGPVVPHGRGEDEVLVDEVGLLVLALALDNGEIMSAIATVGAAVEGCEIDIALVVVGFVDRQPAGVGVVAVEGAAGGGVEG